MIFNSMLKLESIVVSNFYVYDKNNLQAQKVAS